MSDDVTIADDRLGDHHTSLDRLLTTEVPDGYQRAVAAASDVAPQAPRLDRETRGGGTPSRPPPSGDREAAVAALKAVRALVDCSRLAGQPWQPWQAGRRQPGPDVRTRRHIDDHGEETVTVEVRDYGPWPYPDDVVALPSPSEVTRVCKRLAGVIGQPDDPGRARFHAIAAGRALHRAGLLAPPAPDILCANLANGCTNPPRRGGTRCGTCANYKARHGRDRIVGANGRAA